MQAIEDLAGRRAELGRDRRQLGPVAVVGQGDDAFGHGADCASRPDPEASPGRQFGTGGAAAASASPLPRAASARAWTGAGAAGSASARRAPVKRRAQ